MRRLISDVLLVILIAAVLLLALFWAPIDITLTLHLLFGVWVINVVLKATIGFSSDTAFADLSFGSLIFSGNRGIDKVADNFPATLDKIGIHSLIIITCFMGFLWVANLYIIRGLAYNRPDTIPDRRSRMIVTGTSIAIAFLSIASLLYFQYVDLI